MRFNFFRSTSPAQPTVATQAAVLDTGSAERIIAAALGDGEEAVRAAAVGKLPDGEPLRKLAGLGEIASGASSSLKRIAQQRLAQLIDEGTVDFPTLRASSGNVSSILSIAELCRSPSHLPEALAAIDDSQHIARLVVDGSSSRIRQYAAQCIEDPNELRQLLKQTRDGKDRGVYKIIKQKCDALRAEEQRIAKIERDVAALCESLERLGHRVFDALYATSLKLLQEEWRMLEVQASPEMRERARHAIERCREVIGGHERLLAEQAAQASHQTALHLARKEAGARAESESQRLHEAAALAAAETLKLREAEEHARAVKSAAEALALRQLGGLIGKTYGALRAGDTGRAAGLRRALAEKVLAVAAVPAHLAKQMQQLDEKLNELKEWKDYAVAPKRAELIEEMEGLVGSSEEPKVLADRIRRLQEDWKTISKGIVIDSEADWQRFRQASQSAYQPCREYFEAQAELRETNVEKRRAVLERLRAFETAQYGEHPDWRSVAAVLREAPQEWRRYFPVDRAAGRAVQEEFDASIQRLQRRLEAWHAQNAAEKKSLIDRARQLCAKEDSREAVEAVKRLQALWKEVGAAQRDQEQQLWHEFREQCDAVFQKRQQAYTDYTAGLETHKRQAVRLCEEAEQVGALSGPALLEGAAKIPQWRADFEALGEMPKADERGLHARFERALKLCQSRVLQMRARDKELSFNYLLEAARLIWAYGWAVADGGPSFDREALKQTAETFIGGVQHWPKGAAQALKEIWSMADSTAHPDTAAHETALRLLCIRSEILTDKPTPPEDQGLRREYQVQRLVQRMGQGNAVDADELDALALEWVRVGPVAPATHESLLARFLRCR